MNKHYTLLAAGIAVITLGGCQQHQRATPSPMTQLPVVERGVMTVKPASSAQEGLIIPKSALITRGGVTAVFELRDDIARIRMVRTAQSLNGNVQIVSGLSGEETLLAGNLGEVYDGSKIRVNSNK